MTDHEDVIEQLRKVMRLANGAANEGEKNAADAAAKRLAAKHGIDLDDLKVTDSEIRTECFLDDEFRTLPVMEMGYITSVLRQHFGIILVQHRVGRKIRLEWIGTRINVDIAKHATVILLRFSQRDWKDARMARRLARRLASSEGYHDPGKQRALVEISNLNKRAFMDGWFWTIHQKLRANPLRNDKEQFEAEKESAEEMLRSMKNVDDRKGKEHKMSEDDRRAVMMGLRAAEKVNLSRPCGFGGSGKGAASIGVRMGLPMK